jgi:tetratricopeptide (TPR) repeat protein
MPAPQYDPHAAVQVAEHQRAASMRLVRRWQWLALVIAVLATGAAYLNSLHGDFVWDDRKLIVNDRAVKSWRHLGEVFTTDFFERNEDDLPYGYYRPLTTVSYLLDFSLWGLRPFGYHLTNVLLHATCTLLVGVVLMSLGWDAWGVGLAACLFAVHPIHTENVAWVAGRTDLLALLFCLLALTIEIRGAGAPSWGGRTGVSERAVHPRPPVTASIMAVLAFTLAMLAKEMSIVLIGWVAWLYRVAYERPWRDVGWRTLPFLVLAAVYAAWRFLFIAVPVPGVPPEHTLAGVLLSMPPTMVGYLHWLLWPGELNAYVQNPYVKGVAEPRFVLSVLLLIVLAAVSHRWARAVPRAALMLGFLLLSFAPVLNIVRVAAPADMGNVMAERFCYFPSFPFVGLVGLAGSAVMRRMCHRPALRALGVAGMVVVLAAAAAATVRRNRDWADELTFLTRTLEQSPSAVLLWGNLATHHLGNQNLDEAASAIARAAALDPTNYAVLSSQALLYVISDRVADAVPLQQRIVASATFGRVAALNNLAYLYRRSGREDEARRILEDLITAGHGSADVYFNLAEIARARGEIDGARGYYRSALWYRPHDLRIGEVLAALELEAGRPADAEEVYRTLLSLHPDDERVLNNLALITYERGNVAAALDLLARAVEIQPAYVTGRLNYAQLLERAGRPTDALMQLEAATRLASGQEAADAAGQLQSLRSRLATPGEGR